MNADQEPLFSEALIQEQDSELLFDPGNLAHSSNDRDFCQPFIPAYVTLDKKVRCKRDLRDPFFHFKL